MLVSCIMPTRGRTEFARRALFAFLAQTWAERELIVVDDSGHPSCPPDFLRFPFGYTGMPRVVFGKTLGMTLGEKRNHAIALATGSIVMHWDDDDLYRPDRIAHQVQLLKSSRDVGVDVVGYHRMPFLDVESSKQYEFNRPGYLIGVSACYWKSVWEARPFAPRNLAEDQAFMDGRRMVTVESGGRIVATMHGSNTMDKRPLIESDPEHWRLMA